MAAVTNALAMDCEMVGSGRRNLAGRVSIVNERGECVYDKYVQHARNKRITDYRTAISGITRMHLAGGRPYHLVRKEVMNLIRGRILVGHCLGQDLLVLHLNHPKWNKRDTSEYFGTRRTRPSLRNLAAEHLNLSIQNGAHSSREDAHATMRLYMKYKQEWEAESEEEDSVEEEEESEEEDESEEEEESGEEYNNGESYDSSSSSD